MADRSEIESLNFNELKEFLSTKLNDEVSQESLNNLETNRVSGKTFLQLDDGDLSQLFPLIGERKAVKRLIDECTPPPLALVPVAPTQNLCPELKTQVVEWLSKRKETIRLLEKFATDFESFAGRQETIGRVFTGGGTFAMGSFLVGLVAAPFTGGASLALSTVGFMGGWATGVSAGMVGLANQHFAPSIEAIQRALDEDLEKSKHTNQLLAMSSRSERINENDISLKFEHTYRPVHEEVRALVSKLRVGQEAMKALLHDLK